MTENVIFPKSYVVKHTDSLKKKKKQTFTLPYLNGEC